MEEEYDEELPPLNERFNWDNESDDEESPDERKRNRMNTTAMVRKHKNNRHEIKINKTKMICKIYFPERISNLQQR